MSVHIRSVTDPVRSGVTQDNDTCYIILCYTGTDIYWHRSINDERDATRTSRMGSGTIRTLTDELRMRYGRAMDSLIRYGP